MSQVPIIVPIPILDNSVPSNTKETPQPKKPFFSYMYEKPKYDPYGGYLITARIKQGVTILLGAFIVYKVINMIKKK